MSKIDQLQPGQAPQTGQAPKTDRAQGGEAFQKILDQATQLAQGQEPSRAAQARLASQAAQAAQVPQTAQAPSPLQTEGLMRAGRTLDLLDTYALALADQGKPLKEVAGLVKSLQGEAEGLGQVMEKMDPQDGLYGLLQEVAATAQVESIKFNRGDYLNS